MILYRVRDYILNKTNRSSERSTNIIRNIIFSFSIKGVSILVSLLLVPMTIRYINPDQYGIWLTLSSIVQWFLFLDIGFGHGLRNRFAEAKATNNYDNAKEYISTTYICIGIIFTVVWLLFLLVNYFLDWSKILNAPEYMIKELSTTALIVVSFFCLQMILKLINIILIADQQPAKSAFFDMLGQVLALIIIFVFTKTTEGSLVYLALALGFCPVFVMLISSFWFYSHDYKLYKPSFRTFKKDLLKDIFNLGVKFFVAQVAAIVIYQSANIIIAQLFSPGKVTEYNIAYKYFSFPFNLILIIITPMWSAYTDAYTKKDRLWMRNSLKKMRKAFYVVLILSTIMLIFSPKVYSFWVGSSVNIPFSYSFFIYLYMMLLIWVSIHIYTINGIGKVKLQFYFSLCEIVMFIPVSVSLGKLFGVSGVLSAMIVFVLIRAIWSPIQLNKLINGDAEGLWNQ